MESRDRPVSFQELQQDRAQHWRNLARVKALQQEEVREVLRHPWRCPSCGAGGVTDPVCPKCRSARVVELD
jgi:rubrerythrin